MSEPNMQQPQVNHLKIAARTWAAEKAREIVGTTVDHVLTRTGATHFDDRVIREAEAHMQRWLAAWLNNNLLEFTHAYMRDVEERAAHVEKLLNDVANMTPNPPFIKP